MSNIISKKMIFLSAEMLQLALGLSENEPLTKEHLSICEEWTSGLGREIVKISTDDPNILVYAALYDKCENNQEDIWKVISPGKRRHHSKLCCLWRRVFKKAPTGKGWR